MRRALRQPLAVVFALLVVTAGAVGSVAMTNDDVRDLGSATSHVVGSANAQTGSLLGANSLLMAAYETYQNVISNSPNTEDLQKADALETKKEIYDQASIQDANNDLTNTAYQNYLNDTQTIALMEGKQAYIRALENGSAESVARNKATEAVADYYAVKQQNLIASWNISVSVFDSGRVTAKNTTNVSAEYVSFHGENYYSDTDNEQFYGNYTSSNTEANLTDIHPESVTLVNATSEDVLALQFQLDSGTSHQTFNTTLKDGEPSLTNSNGRTISVHNMSVAPPTSDYDRLTLAEFGGRHSARWTEIQAQNDEVQSQLDDFINATYDDYQQGDINTSELVDPYLGAREYSPETSDSWALRTLSAMGAGSPQNLSNIGVMNVSAGGNTYSGVLMSDGTPEGGYVVGETYNASNITGGQFVAELDGGSTELTGDFTLESAEMTNGTAIKQGEVVKYRTVEYKTANTTEFKQLQEELDLLTAEINARQQELRNSGGTGWLPDFGVNVGVGGIAIVAALGAVFLLGRS